jgi:Arc/MetJ family transcription regulator
MRTTLDIDGALMRKAMRLSGLSTKKAVVEAALRLLIQTRSQSSPLDVKGVKLAVSPH